MYLNSRFFFMPNLRSCMWLLAQRRIPRIPMIPVFPQFFPIGQGLDVLGEDAFVCHGRWAPWKMMKVLKKCLKSSFVLLEIVSCIFACQCSTHLQIIYRSSTCHTVCDVLMLLCLFLALLLWSLRCNMSRQHGTQTEVGEEGILHVGCGGCKCGRCKGMVWRKIPLLLVGGFWTFDFSIYLE